MVLVLVQIKGYEKFFVDHCMGTINEKNENKLTRKKQVYRKKVLSCLWKAKKVYLTHEQFVVLRDKQGRKVILSLRIKTHRFCVLSSQRTKLYEDEAHTNMMAVTSLKH